MITTRGGLGLYRRYGLGLSAQSKAYDWTGQFRSTSPPSPSSLDTWRRTCGMIHRHVAAHLV